MKNKYSLLILNFLFFFINFILQKPIFLLVHRNLYSQLTITDFFQIIWHGSALDLSMAAYLSVIPLFITLIPLRLNYKSNLLTAYYSFVSLLIALVWIVDLQLYSHWGFRLDTTPLFYFFTSPKNALASITLIEGVAGVFVFITYAGILIYLLRKIIRYSLTRLNQPISLVKNSLLSISFIVLLFILIRGGVTVSTMNLSRVYFSNNTRLNHAAINPMFSLMDSYAREQNFSKQYNYYTIAEAAQKVKPLAKNNLTDKPKQVIKEAHPNIVLIILESFSSHLIHLKDQENKEVTPYLNSLIKESIFFENFYANSFRTDRGLISILSGYPAQPTTSIMKYPKKTQNLASIQKSLKENNYSLFYYYGGDVNFTNMNAYLVSSGFDQLVSDKNFPVSEKLSKWGAHDDKVFDKAKMEYQKQVSKSPFFTVIQTSSSHEPFEVPTKRLQNNILNAFNYTDACLQSYIEHLKQQEEWNNTLIVLIPDHLGAYPSFENSNKERYHIPMLWYGGAITEPMIISSYGSQIDLCTTLLNQLAIDSSPFPYSKDLLSSTENHYAIFTYPNLMGYVTDSMTITYDLEKNDIITFDGYKQKSKVYIDAMKAYIQLLYNDFDKK